MNKKTKIVYGNHEMTGFLYDQMSEKNIKATVRFVNGMITISVNGYGDLTSKKNKGEPILVESFDNDVKVVLWGDINKEDATHIINMEGAKEKNRI